MAGQPQAASLLELAERAERLGFDFRKFQFRP
jgi:alkanesulfonate monooxygenase SsuD/methylene tetrahydromethanopterin reductase-like flavin-dependent oxidoreductase (luciferase family)